MKQLTLICGRLFTALFCLALCPVSGAAIITFNGLTGPHALSVSSYSEGGYTVTPSAGAWGEGHMFGNGVPSILSSSSIASVDVTRIGGGTFGFSSVDLGNGGTGMPNFFIQGFLSGNPVFGLSSSLGMPNSFSTVPSYNTGIQMDTLRINLYPMDSPSVLIDNIGINVVPEPGSLALLCMAALAVAFRPRS